MMCSQPAPTRHRLTWQPPALRRLQQISPHAVPLRRKVKGFPHPLLVRRVLPLHLRLKVKAPHPHLLSLQEVGDVSHETQRSLCLCLICFYFRHPAPHRTPTPCLACQKRKVGQLGELCVCTLEHLCQFPLCSSSAVLKVKDDPRYKDFFRKLRIVSACA